MSIKGKREYKVYLDEEQTEYVKSFLEMTKNKGGLSGLVDGYIKTIALTLKTSGYKPGQKKLSVSQLFKIGINGLKQNPA